MIIPIPITVPIIRNYRQECIIQNDKTYCIKNNLSSQDLGFIIISSTIWITIFSFLLYKHLENDWSPMIPCGFLFLSFICWGLYYILL